MRDPDGNWIYFSKLLPGYTEKYTLRGVRERNRHLVRLLSGAVGEGDGDRIRDLLIDNNRPLARFAAAKWARMNGWTDAEEDDAYQENCLALTLFFRTMQPGDYDGKSHGFLSIAMFAAMRNNIYAKTHRKSAENLLEAVPYNEEAFPQEETFGIDTEYLFSFIDKRLRTEPQRSRQILLQYFLGDPDSYIEPMQSEDVALYHDLTRNAVLTRINKTLKLLNETQRNYAWNLGMYRKQDFFNQIF